MKRYTQAAVLTAAIAMCGRAEAAEFKSMTDVPVSSCANMAYLTDMDGRLWWNPAWKKRATVPGRHSMATFFRYYCDYTMSVRQQPGNIVVRNCAVENAARLVRYNFGGETWQRARPLADIRLEGVKATGMWLPVAFNGGSSKDGDAPIDITMSECSLGFAKPQPEVFSVANVRTLSLADVTVSGVSAPLVRTWNGTPELRLSGVEGASPVVAKGEGTFECPPR